MIAIMKCVTMKRWASLLAALLLCVLLCSVPVLADEAGGESSTASAESAPEDASAADSFFNQPEAGNGIGSTLFTAGAVLVGAGVVGIICLIVWQCVSKRHDRVAEDREDIFDEIEQAEQPTRRRPAAPPRRRFPRPDPLWPPRHRHRAPPLPLRRPFSCASPRADGPKPLDAHRARRIPRAAPRDTPRSQGR